MSLTTGDITDALATRGFTRVEPDSGWTLLLGPVTASPEEVFGWVREYRDRFARSGGGRGERHDLSDGPGEHNRWFIKAYHHGGLLAEEGDLDYDSPRRFLLELLASKVVADKQLAPVEPKGVAYRKTEAGYRGFYFSRAVDADPLTRRLRTTGDTSLVRRAGELLAELHDLGIDHGDYHVNNLLVAGEERVFPVDFDPVELGTVNPWIRGFRLHRFRRSLDKHGFRSEDEAAFLEGYRGAVSHYPVVSETVQTPLFAAKNRLSDLLYRVRGQEFSDRDAEKILVRAPNWLGDAVMSLPLLQSLQRQFPGTILDVVARASVLPVYERHEAVRHGWELPEDKELKFPESIDQERYSALLVLPKSLRTGIQAWRSGIPRRIGFSTQGRGVLLTDPIPLNNRDREVHHARLFYDLTAPWMPVPEDLPEPRLQAPDPTDSLRGSLPEDPYFTVHPGSAYGPAKRWPVDRFAEFLDRLYDQFGWPLVALGVESERSLASDLLADYPGSSWNAAGQTELPEAMTVLQRSRGTVANDSGIMHLSAALDTPTLGIFGSSDPQLTAPLGRRTAYLYEDVECSPCFERTCPLDEDRYKCLERITPDAALDAFRDLLGEGSTPGANGS